LEGIVRFRTGLVGVVVVVLVATAGCARGTTSSSGSAPGSQPVPMAPSAAARTSPQQLRAQFDQLLGQHTVLAVRLMRSVVMAAPDFRQAASVSVQDNTAALSKLVASTYDSAQGDRFEQLWQRHIADLFSYANAVASHDASATQAARASLSADADAYGAWLAAASKGRVRASDAAAGVRAHVEDLMKQLDAYAAHDYDQAYGIERMAYEHMFAAGTTLVKASMAPESAVGLDAPPERLRTAFTELLGEHLELIVDAQRATFAGSPEFRAAAAQVNANTAALAQAMGAIVGPAKAAQFQAAWADHVDGLMGYAAAVAGRDQAGMAAAQRRLDGFAARLARYFSGVVRNPAAVAPLTMAVTMHDTHLTNQVNAYQAKDYGRAQQLELDGYQQMIGVANTLVDAIQQAVQRGLPVGGAQTGGGGTARRRA
jgi:hypothetical protein